MIDPTSRGLGIINPFTHQWEDTPPDFSASASHPFDPTTMATIKEKSAWDPELKRYIAMNQAGWDRVKAAILDGREDLRSMPANRVKVLTELSIALNNGAGVRFSP